MKTTLELLLGAAAEQDLQVMLVGGYALPAHGVVRQTVDLDCLIVDTEFPKLAGALSQAGFEEIQRTASFARYRHPSVYLMDLDVMFVDRQTFQKVSSRAVACRIDQFEMRVPCVAHLIALKLHAIKNNPTRINKDIRDIVDLVESNSRIISMTELKSLCEEFGPPAFYDKLIGFL